MKFDMSFEVKEDGVTLKCDILEVIPNDKNNDEPYVIYTDYSLDDNDEFVKKTGKLISDGDNFYIEKNISNAEIVYVENKRKNHVVSYVNEMLNDALYGDDE